jgi:oligopeptidase A
MEKLVLNQAPLPLFKEIAPQQIEATLTHVLNQNRQELRDILANQQHYTWDNLMVPLEEMGNRLNKMWAPVSHLHSVMESEELRAAYNICMPLLTDYYTDLMQNEQLYLAIKSLAESAEAKSFNDTQRKVLANELRDFKLAGVNLPSDAKIRFSELQKKLSKLTTQFAENLLDATHGWSLHVTDLALLKGLPEQTIKIAAQTAQEKGKEGWMLTLDYPCYSSVMKYLDNRELRAEMYKAYVTRASDQGPNAGRWDNTDIMEEIVKTRHELASLVGFSNFATYSLATKMAKEPEQVLTFLNDLLTKSKSFAERDIQELAAFANMDKLEAWDLAYYSEKLQVAKYAVSEEELRAYFPVEKVLDGMFKIMGRLFGIKIKERINDNIWHPQVKFFEVYDAENKLRGYFYTDLFARPHKRDGAWMDECRIRQRLPDNTLQYPVAFLTCNFTRPLDGQTALLTHDEVQTVFHEFGHCLHHLLTQVDYASLSGINGVPWDAVEFPSQFFEHWCWNQEALDLISAHVTTGEPLPPALYDKMLAAKNFQSGMQMLRQLEFALFDFRLHLEFDPTKQAQVQTILNDVRNAMAVVPIPSFNRFQHSFSHIFSGGYAAGYYSYKWAEVLSSDAFSRFEEQGIFDEASGHSYLTNILEQGGVYEPMDLFIAFRGREPSIDALLQHSGLVN